MLKRPVIFPRKIYADSSARTFENEDYFNIFVIRTTIDNMKISGIVLYVTTVDSGRMNNSCIVRKVRLVLKSRMGGAKLYMP